jgi:hypothetical protein
VEFKRQIICPPSWADLDKGTRAKLSAADDRLVSVSCFRSADGVAHLEITDEIRARMAHALSPWIMERLADAVLVPGRSMWEAQCLNLEWDQLQAALAGDISFAACVEAIARRIDAGARIRTSGVGAAPDTKGDTIVFPAAGHVSAALASIGDQVRSVRSSPLFSATVVLARIVNCHPFLDGNGRVGRILFNSILMNCGLDRKSYIPLYDVFRCTDGGYEIRLRMAETQDKWDDLLCYMSDVVYLLQEV